MWFWIKTFSLFAFVLIVVSISGYIKWTVWNECRETHSWFYCHHAIGGK